MGREVLLVQEVREAYESLWREWQAWPAALRPTTGERAFDAVLANPLLFLPTDNIYVGVRDESKLWLYFYLLRAETGLPADYEEEEAVEALMHAHPVAFGALAELHDALERPIPSLGLVPQAGSAGKRMLVGCLVYDLGKLLAEAPWAPDEGVHQGACSVE